MSADSTVWSHVSDSAVTFCDEQQDRQGGADLPFARGAIACDPPTLVAARQILPSSATSQKRASAGAICQNGSSTANCSDTLQLRAGLLSCFMYRLHECEADSIEWKDSVAHGLARILRTRLSAVLAGKIVLNKEKIHRQTIDGILHEPIDIPHVF